jgi:hypothetical protein
MKNVKRALITACIMLVLTGIYDLISFLAWFRDHPLVGLGTCAWDFVIVGLLVFAIRGIKNSN